MRLFLLASSRLDEFWTSVLDSLVAEPKVEIVGACIDARKPVPIGRRLRREIDKGRGAYVAVMAVKLLARALNDRSTATHPYLRERGVPARDTNDLYGPETLEFIRGTAPDCIFRFGFGLIREPVLSLAPKGVISYHHGNIRRYRGQPVAFWELLNGESEMAVTVQVLTEQLDAGRIVVERPVPIGRTDTWRALERRAYDTSRSMVREACVLLDRPGHVPELVPENELGALYTTPNFREWATLQRRVLARRIRTRRETSRATTEPSSRRR